MSENNLEVPADVQDAAAKAKPKQRQTRKPTKEERYKVPIYVQRILLEYSGTTLAPASSDGGETTPDEDPRYRSTNVKEICDKLKEVYGLEVSKDMINKVLAALEEMYKQDYELGGEYAGTNLVGDMGLEVLRNNGVDYKSSKQWYRIIRPFDEAEVAALINICANANGGHIESDQLCKKLASLLSREERTELLSRIKEETAGASAADKAKNARFKTQMQINALIMKLYYINQAIESRRMVAFEYPGKGSKAYVPYAVGTVDGYYYLRARYLNRNGVLSDIVNLRIDRMGSISVGERFIIDEDEDQTAEPAEEPAENGAAPALTERIAEVDYLAERKQRQYEFRTTANRMFKNVGEVKVRCVPKTEMRNGEEVTTTKKRILINEFGDHPGFREYKKDGEVRYSFEVSLEGFKYWAIKRCQDFEVLEPLKLRNEIIQALTNNPYLETKKE